MAKAQADIAFDSEDRSESAALSVVMPAYNEAENLKALVPEIIDVAEAFDDQYEVVIVDDGSEDETAQAIRRFSALYDSVTGVFLSRNFGQSSALSAGIETATGDTVVTMDADGQNDPSDIPVLLDRLNDGVACVSGHRANREDPLTKRVPSRIQTTLAKLTGPDINDFGCTLKAYRAEALEHIQVYGEGHRYIPAKLYARGYSVEEIPVNHRGRTNGTSHYGVGRLLRGFVDLWTHVFLTRYSTRPMHVFGGVGVGLASVGSVLGLHIVALRVFWGVPMLDHLPRLILIALLVIAGIMLFSLGVIAELLVRLIYREETPYRIQEVVK